MRPPFNVFTPSLNLSRKKNNTYCYNLSLLKKELFDSDLILNPNESSFI